MQCGISFYHERKRLLEQDKDESQEERVLIIRISDRKNGRLWKRKCMKIPDGKQ